MISKKLFYAWFYEKSNLLKHAPIRDAIVVPTFFSELTIFFFVVGLVDNTTAVNCAMRIERRGTTVDVKRDGSCSVKK